MGLNLNTLKVQAGDVVVSNFGAYQHWSIVSDLVCDKGMPMLISATKRHGTVKEESWEKVTQGKRTYIAQVQCNMSVEDLLFNARSQIDNWVYSLTSKNCEHFVKWAARIEVSSKQVAATTTGAVLGATFVGMCAENPKFVHFLGGAVVLGGLALLGTKALEKKSNIQEK